jgi:uncharacterized membrane protein
MSFYQILSMVHGNAAILLFALAILSIVFSVLIAVRPVTHSANHGLAKKANIVSLIEITTLGVVAVTGLVAVFMASLPLSQTWLWLGLVIVVFYGFALQFVTKRARLNVPQGTTATKVGMQVALQVAHLLLLIVAFALMALKPA